MGTDEHGILAVVNTNLQNSLGYSKQNLMGKPIRYIHPNDLPIIQSVWGEIKTRNSRLSWRVRQWKIFSSFAISHRLSMSTNCIKHLKSGYYTIEIAGT